MCADLLDRVSHPVEQALKASSITLVRAHFSDGIQGILKSRKVQKMPIEACLFLLSQEEIESVILVGGGTRVPKVQELLLKAVKK